MLRTLALTGCALGALLIVGCGDDDGGGSVDCSTFAACGGDLTGSWTIQDACFGDFNPVEEFCPDATVDLSGVSFSGTVEFLADDTYSVTSSQSGSFVVTVPGSCLEGLAESCDDLDDDETDCTGDVTDSCECTSSFDDDSTESGTYATSGNSVTLTPTGEDADTSDYCVDGDVLKLRQAGDDVSITFALTKD